MAAIEEKDESKEESSGISCCDRVKWFIQNVTVEPLMLCYILPSVLAELAMQNLNLEKACRVDLQYDNSTCDAMYVRNATGYTKDEEATVQKLVATMTAIRNIFQSILPCIVLVFIGSWSDRYKRRLPCILIPIAGEIFAIIGFILLTYFFYELPIIFNILVHGIIPGLSGGWAVMFMGANAYICDISSIETRTVRIGALTILSNASIPIGIAVSGILLMNFGFYVTFSFALGLLTIGFFYGMFVVKENSKEFDFNKKQRFACLRDFFKFSYVKETMVVAFKAREKNFRSRIMVCLLLIMLIVGPLHGEMTVMYLFLRYKFGWNETDYGIFLTVHFLIQISGTAFSLYILSKRFKIHDAVIGALAAFCKVVACIVMAFAPTAFYFYLGIAIEALHGASFVAMRAIISKLVPPNELGKVYSLMGASEALMPLIYGPLFGLIYRQTIDIFPSAFYFIGAILTAPCIFIFLWLYNQYKLDDAQKEKEVELAVELLAITEADATVNT